MHARVGFCLIVLKLCFSLMDFGGGLRGFSFFSWRMLSS